MIQANQVVEAVTHKVRRQLDDLDQSTNADSTTLVVDGIPIDIYITRCRGNYSVIFMHKTCVSVMVR